MISEKDIIYVTKKQASIASAILACLCLFIFMLGYFWGKQSVIDDFNQRVAQDSAQDQMDYLVTIQSFAEGDKPKQDASVDKEVEPGKVVEALVEKIEPEVKPTEEKKEVKSEAKPHQYYAILLGFGTKAAAAGFVNRLKKHNINVDVRTRKSKTSSGKITKIWYQAVTKSYKSKTDLQKIIDRIVKLEKIKSSDIKIV